ncbi:hypothetical protein BCU91_17265 [Shewanella sp. 10N.286.52.B9]|nr:hypothetical protein BCU91_17265 [Shewanella sp. 10N.286.52.B9]
MQKVEKIKWLQLTRLDGVKVACKFSARKGLWLLAAPLCNSSATAKRIVKIYATRIQIEESFRDVKTGLKMNDSGTRSQDKLSVLLLIACLSQFIFYLLGLAVKPADKHRQYQANSSSTAMHFQTSLLA